MPESIDPIWCAWMCLSVAEAELADGSARHWTHWDAKEIADAIIAVCREDA